MSLQSLQLDSWKNTEWFGVEWPYVPFWEANEYHTAYGLYNEGIKFEIDGSFDYICVFLAGEFLCSFELDSIPEENSTLLLNGLSLIKEQKSIKDAVQ